jgi:hypothetical protein
MQNKTRGFLPLLIAIVVGIIAVAGITTVSLRVKAPQIEPKEVTEIATTSPSAIGSQVASTDFELKQEVAKTLVAPRETKIEPVGASIKPVEGCPPGATYNGFSGELCPGNQSAAFQRPAEAPTPEDLKKLVWMCSFNEDLKTTCGTSAIIEGYFTNMNFRKLMNALIVSAQAKLAEQAKNDSAAQDRYIKYLAATTPINSSLLPRVETYETPVYKGSLSLPALEQPKKPIRWEVRWEGGGEGTITDYSSNTLTRFHCESGGCRSY